MNPSGEPQSVARIAGRHDDCELLAPEPADDIRHVHRGLQQIGDGHQYRVTRRVTEDVVDLLEVVDVGDQQRARVVAAGRPIELRAKALVKVPVVVEAGQRVSLGCKLELGAVVSVLDRQRNRASKSLGDLELFLGEGCILALPVDIQAPFIDPFVMQRDAQ